MAAIFAYALVDGTSDHIVLLDDGEGFNQADLVDGGDYLFVLASTHNTIGYLFAGQQLVKRDLVGFQIKIQ